MLTNEKQQSNYNERAMLLQLLKRLQVQKSKDNDKIKWTLKKNNRQDKEQVSKNMSPISTII